MSEVTVGDYYIDGNGDVWRMVLYCAEPTATLERLRPHDRDERNRPRVGGAVGAPIFEDFERLVPER